MTDRLHIWDYSERIRQPSIFGMRCRNCGLRQYEAGDSCNYQQKGTTMTTKNTRSPWDLRQMAREAFLKGKHTQANDLANEADRLEDQLFNDDARRLLIEKRSQEAVKREVAARRQARNEAHSEPVGEASMVTANGGKA